jgi:hypothetical protein
VLIDGLSEPGPTPGVPGVVLDGGSAGAGANGLEIGPAGAGSTIRGLQIQNFGADGVDITGSGGDTVVANTITGNGGFGIDDAGNGDSFISTSSAPNSISANVAGGIAVGASAPAPGRPTLSTDRRTLTVPFSGATPGIGNETAAAYDNPGLGCQGASADGAVQSADVAADGTGSFTFSFAAPLPAADTPTVLISDAIKGTAAFDCPIHPVTNTNDSGRGAIDVLETTARAGFSTSAASLSPAPGQFVLSRAHLTARRRATLSVALKLHGRAKRLVERHRHRCEFVFG